MDLCPAARSLVWALLGIGADATREQGALRVRACVSLGSAFTPMALLSQDVILFDRALTAHGPAEADIAS